MDELEEIRQKSQTHEPWEDTSAAAHDDEYELDSRANVFSPVLRRVIAAIILIVLLWGTWQYVTFQFLPEEVRNPKPSALNKRT